MRRDAWVRILHAAMTALGALFLVACGVLPHSPRAAQQTKHTPIPISIGSVLRFTTVPPSLVIDHNDPRVLAVNTSLNQLMLYRRIRNGWHEQVLLKASLSTLFGADTLICQSTGCLAAAELGGTASSAQIIVFCQGAGSKKWSTVWRTTAPLIAAGATLQLAANGHDVWLLSTGSPGAGLMPKLLWMSQNNGQTWRLVASGDLPTIKAPFTIPQGYPTGVVALSSGQLILSLSPRGNSATVAIKYTAAPLTENPLTFSVPSTFQPIMESLPAITGSPDSLPLIDQKGYLALATSSAELPWPVHSTHILTDESPLATSGLGTAAIINTTKILLLSSQGRVLTLPIRREFITPLVTAVIGHQSVVVLGKDGTLWVNTRTGSWHRFNESRYKLKPSFNRETTERGWTERELRHGTDIGYPYLCRLLTRQNGLRAHPLAGL